MRRTFTTSSHRNTNVSGETHLQLNSHTPIGLEVSEQHNLSRIALMSAVSAIYPNVLTLQGN